jgi:pimeloyl-ACP methyl ester carboxylesterase
VPYADLSKARIYYEVSGPADGLPLLLIHGLGASIAMWDPGLIAAFEQARFRVIQFDNRDVGWSSTSPAPFELADMAQDARELVKHVGLDRVHVAGQSMGGMIAQQFAISYPEVTLSLTSIYSAPGRDHIVSDPELAAEHRQQGAASSREEAVQQFIARETISGLEGLDEAWIRAYAERVIDRDYEREASHHGRTIQMQSIMNAPDRTADLEKLDVPAAVIHGRNDPLISFAGGIATARAIPGAELHIFANMRHQLRRDLWPDFVRIIQRTALRAAS